MPDLDRVERCLLPSWRPSYRLLKGGHPPEEVGRAALKALAEALRNHGGAPGLYEFAGAIADSDRGVLDPRSFAAMVQTIQQHFQGRHGRLMADSALGAVASGRLAFLEGPAHERIAKRFCEDLLSHSLFARARSFLVGKRFRSLSEAVQFEAQVRAAIDTELSSLAKRLTKNPAALGLRAPNYRGVRRKSTSELLNEPLF